MNVALVYFTYERDAELLGMSLQALPQLRSREGDEVSVFVFDDANAPLAVVPEGVVYEQTSFDRKGNLNGLECIDGMLALYESVFERTGAEWIVKLDCDTYLNDLDWLRGMDAATVAQAGCRHVNDFCSGACYAVSRAGVAAVRERLTGETWRKRARKAWCEDRVIGRIAETTAFRVVWLGSIFNEPKRGVLYHDWMNDGEACMELLVAPYAVDFKRCRWNSVPDDYEKDREKGTARMRAYVEFLKQEKETEQNEQQN